jgi:hypothetical protein
MLPAFARLADGLISILKAREKVKRKIQIFSNNFLAGFVWTLKHGKLEKSWKKSHKNLFPHTF